MGQAKTAAEELKELQEKINLLSVQQTTQAKLNKALTTALKEQADADALLEKTKAQFPFVQLEAIRENLSKFVPQGKDGKITVAQGTAGALLLKYKGAMLKAIDAAAKTIAEKIQAKNERSVILGSNADYEAAYKSQLIEKSIIAHVTALARTVEITPLPANMKAPPFMKVSSVSAVAAAGLVLNTITDFSKFFRTDSAISVFDAGEEANILLELFFEAHMVQKGQVIHLGEQGDNVLKVAQETADSLGSLKFEHEKAARHLELLENVANGDKTNLPEGAIDQLRFQITSTGELLEALNPLSNSEVFWAHVTGLAKHKKMLKPTQDTISSDELYYPRLVMNAKAQTVQIHKTKVWTDDEISGRGEIQVDYRVSKSNGELIVSGVFLKSIESDSQQEVLILPS